MASYIQLFTKTSVLMLTLVFSFKLHQIIIGLLLIIMCFSKGLKEVSEHYGVLCWWNSVSGLLFFFPTSNSHERQWLKNEDVCSYQSSHKKLLDMNVIRNNTNS